MSFLVQQVSLQLASELRSLLPRLRQLCRELEKQLLRAALSITLNLAEGNGRDGKDRQYHFRIARGSAREVEAALQFSVAVGFIEDDEVRKALDHLNQILSMIAGLLR